MRVSTRQTFTCSLPHHALNRLTLGRLCVGAAVVPRHVGPKTFAIRNSAPQRHIEAEPRANTEESTTPKPVQFFRPTWTKIFVVLKCTAQPPPVPLTRLFRQKGEPSRRSVFLGCPRTSTPVRDLCATTDNRNAQRFPQRLLNRPFQNRVVIRSGRLFQQNQIMLESLLLG